MPVDWHMLSNETRMTLAHAALTRAAETIACQAELLADEIDLGNLVDPGGAEALRIFAAVVRSREESPLAVAGHC